MQPTTRQTRVDDGFATDSEVELIEDTLVLLLREISTIDAEAAALGRGGHTALGAHRIPARFLDDTQAQRATRDLIRTPLRAACAAAISVLGARLNEIDGKPAMLDAYNHVVARAGRHKAWWSRLIEERFGVVPEWLD